MKSLFFGSVSRRVALIGALALLVMSALLPTTAFAASNEKQPVCAANNVKCVITYGDTIIVKRQKALNTLNDKVTTALSNHEITSAQASVLQTDIAAAQSNLTNYKKKMDAEKSETSARQDITNLWTKLRIYAVVLPRDYRTLEFDYEVNAETLMQNISPVIQAGLTLVSTNQQSQLNPLYSDYSKQIANAQPQIQIAQGALPAFTVANYNQHYRSFQTSKSTLDKALQQASDALFKASDDLKQMARILGISG